MQFSFLRSQTAFSYIKTSYDVLIRPINMEMSCENAADRSLPYFTTAARAPSEMHFVDHGYRGLSYCCEWILSSEIIWCTRVYQHVKFVEKLCASDFVCWHTTYQHRHTNNQTNHSDFESSTTETWTLPTVSLSDLTVVTLFHRQARPKTSFSQPWKTACVTGDIPRTRAKCFPDSPRQQYCSLLV